MASRVLVSLGSNLGDSTAILAEARDLLRETFPQSFRFSSIRRTRPVNCPEGVPDFHNAAAVFEASEPWTPLSLLEWLLEQELRFGPRPRLTPNAPRFLDMDLIDFGGRVMQTVPLTLPHPRALERRFVLEPVAEIAPDLRIGGGTWTAQEALRRLP